MSDIKFNKIQKRTLFEQLPVQQYNQPLFNNHPRYQNINPYEYYNNFQDYIQTGQYYNPYQRIDPMLLALMSIINNNSNNRNDYQQTQQLVKEIQNSRYDDNDISDLRMSINNLSSDMDKIYSAVNDLINRFNDHAYNHKDEAQFYHQSFPQYEPPKYEQPQYKPFEEYYEEPQEYYEEPMYNDGRDEYYMKKNNYNEFMNILKEDVKNSREEDEE